MALPAGPISQRLGDDDPTTSGADAPMIRVAGSPMIPGADPRAIPSGVAPGSVLAIQPTTSCVLEFVVSGPALPTLDATGV